MSRFRYFVATIFLVGSLIVSHGSAQTVPVSVREEFLTLPWYTSKPYYKINPRRDLDQAFFVVPGTQKLVGDRKFKTVTLENKFIRVQLIPEIGGAVARAIYKPTGDDFFFLEGKAKDWRPYWESGVKVSS